MKASFMPTTLKDLFTNPGVVIIVCDECPAIMRITSPTLPSSSGRNYLFPYMLSIMKRQGWRVETNDDSYTTVLSRAWCHECANKPTVE